MSALLNNRDYRHGTTEKIGVLLINLGTPAAPTTAAVRAYLRQFLSDRRVIESPRWRWLPVLFGAVLPFRSPRTAAAYQKIWTADGSPLLVYSRAQRQKIAAALNDKTFIVELAMSYGAPSIDSALLKLHAQNCRRLLILPLYPQYSSSTAGSVFVDVTRNVARWRAVPHFRFVAAYCDDSRYVEVLAESIAAHWQGNARPDKLIFSFHGTPQAMLEAGDPYYCLCRKTARLAAAKLNLREAEWMVTFQSRFGTAEWLRPYTDETMKTLPAVGVRHVQVVAPAFAADCLETLEEIAQETRRIFLAAGGKNFGYIPALNDSPAHINFLCELIRDNTADWLQHLQQQNTPAVRELQKEQATELKNKLANADNSA